MTTVPLYMVQSFAATTGGLRPDPPIAVRSACEARYRGGLLARRAAAVVAWVEIGDPYRRAEVLSFWSLGKEVDSYGLPTSSFGPQQNVLSGIAAHQSGDVPVPTEVRRSFRA
jgi:hypothetical protein